MARTRRRAPQAHAALEPEHITPVRRVAGKARKRVLARRDRVRVPWPKVSNGGPALAPWPVKVARNVVRRPENVVPVARPLVRRECIVVLVARPLARRECIVVLVARPLVRRV